MTVEFFLDVFVKETDFVVIYGYSHERMTKSQFLNSLHYTEYNALSIDFVESFNKRGSTWYCYPQSFDKGN